jgi:hypothetical protein
MRRTRHRVRVLFDPERCEQTLRRARLIDMPWPRRWRCDASSCARDEGCDACRIYRCMICKTLRDWSNGGTDSPVCDACWWPGAPPWRFEPARAA